MNSVSLECILKVISCVATVLPCSGGIFTVDMHCISCVLKCVQGQVTGEIVLWHFILHDKHSLNIDIMFLNWLI